MGCGTEKAYFPQRAIFARFVDWDVTGDPEEDDVDYTFGASFMMSTLNSTHARFTYKKGRLKEAYFQISGETCTDKSEILWFQVSSTKSGNELIGDQYYVARPCPPFCEDGGIDPEAYKLLMHGFNWIEYASFTTNI